MAAVIQKAVRRQIPMAAKPGGSAFPDTTAVPLADGGTHNRSKEICHACRTSGIHGIALCKTENFSVRLTALKTAVLWRYRFLGTSIKMPCIDANHDRLYGKASENRGVQELYMLSKT